MMKYIFAVTFLLLVCSILYSNGQELNMLDETAIGGENYPDQVQDPYQFNGLPLCFPDKLRANHVLSQPVNCAGLNWHEAKPFKADIFSPKAITKKVEAHACRIEKKTNYYYLDFWQVQTKKPLHTDISIPNKQRCENWRDLHDDRKDGQLKKFKQDENGVDWITQIPMLDNFWWLQESKYEATNGFLTSTTLIFNKITHEVLTTIDSHVDCKLEEGYCQSKTHMYIFDAMTKKELNCPDTNVKVATDTRVYLHDNGQHKYLAAPDVDLAFASFEHCSERFESCNSGYTSHVCTSNHFVIASRNKNAIVDSIESKAIVPDSTTEGGEVNTAAAIEDQMFAKVSIQLDTHMSRVKNLLLQLQCRNNRLHLTNLLATQQINPSQVLTTLLHRPAYGTMSSGTLQEIMCVETNAILRTTLQVGGRKSSRPIFTVHVGGQNLEAQWTNDGYLRLGLRDFLPHTNENSISIFQIRDRTLMYQNGTLKPNKAPHVTELGVTTTKITYPTHILDPSLANHMLAVAAPPQGYNMLQQGLAALSALNTEVVASRGVMSEKTKEFLYKAGTREQRSAFLEELHRLFFMGLMQFCIKWLIILWAVVGSIVILFVIGKVVMKFIKTRQAAQAEKESVQKPSPIKTIIQK